jgi:hypothetical protein
LFVPSFGTSCVVVAIPLRSATKNFPNFLLSDRFRECGSDRIQEQAMNGQFSELAELLEHDPDKVLRVIEAFHRSASKDLNRLEQAADACEWQIVRGMAHRLHVSFLHVGARDAAAAAAMLASVPGELFVEIYHRRRPIIAESLDRAEEFLGRATSEGKRDR